jgi:hypothetical protein
MKAERKIDPREKYPLKDASMNVRITFVNIGLGRQKTAQNFWISLSEPLTLEEIMLRVEKGFGDLNNEKAKVEEPI